MAEIHCVYIVDVDGIPIFIHEKYTQGSMEVNHALFSGFVAAFQTFISELGANETNIVLGNSSIFSSFDDLFQLYYILKCALEANEKEMNQTLKKIKDLVEKYLPKTFIKVKDIDFGFLEKLRNEINELIKPKTNVATFLEILM